MNELKNEKADNDYIVVILAAACGTIVANLYYAQPLIASIGMDLGLPLSLAGVIVTFTQIGYVLGLLFLVPLLDLVENHRLVIFTMMIAVAALIISAVSKSAAIFLLAAVAVGLGSTATQILVPYAAYLSDEANRGKTVGKVMSGLLLGIMLARPVSGFIAGIWGWQSVFLISAAVTVVLGIVLALTLPKRKPAAGIKYTALLYSLWLLFKDTPILRRRAFYQAALFGSFSLFWAAVPLWLADNFGLTHQGVALFSLAGVAGAIAAPIAGSFADRGKTAPLTGAAMITAMISFIGAAIFTGKSAIALAILVLCAILLDMAVSGNLVLSQRIIYSLGDKVRGRLNGVFMALFFVGGATGSLLGSWSYSYGGWLLTALAGGAMAAASLLYYFTES